MVMKFKHRGQLSAKERVKRKRLVNATLVTCAALIMVVSSIHVIDIGHSRVYGDMPNKATYDLSEMHSRIRAAGEDITRHERHEAGRTQIKQYTAQDFEQMLPTDMWHELDALVTIPAGTFLMGSDRVRTSAQNRPQFALDMPEYRIDKYLVTNAQYARFVSQEAYRPPLDWENGAIPPGSELHPVTMVSWYDASNYCVWAGKRLPSEPEWEKAARGTDGRRWPWGDDMDVSRLNTYYSVGSASDVTTYSNGASPYGVMDMAGNVFQWLEDDFEAYPGSDAPDEIFKGKIQVASTPADRAMKVVDLVGVDANYKVLRGGSWKSDPFSTATYHRNYSWPHYASDFFGFRCAAEAEGD